MRIPLKKLRDHRGVTQGELAKILDVSPSAVGMWEQGRREPDYDTLIKIANLFNVTTDFLLGKDTAAPVPPPPPPLNEDENNLLNSFRRLPSDGKKALLAVVKQMAPVRRSFVHSGLCSA